MGVAQLLQRLAVGEVFAGEVGQPGHLGIEQGDIDLLPFPAALPRQQRCQHRQRGVDPGGNIGNRGRKANRLAAFFTGDEHRAAHSLGDHIVSRPLGIGSGIAESADIGHDQPFIQRLAGGGIQAELFAARAARHVMHQHIGFAEQLFQDLPPLRPAQIQGQAALVAVGAQEVGAILADERRPPPPGLIPLAGAFDLDHLCPQIAQQLGAVRPGQGRSMIQHQHPLQRSGGTFSHHKIS